MYKRFRVLCFALAGLFLAIGITMPPKTLVDHFLPAVYESHSDLLRQGLWVLKGALLFDALICLCLPYLSYIFIPIGRPSLPLLSRMEKYFLISAVLVASVIRAVGLTQGFGYDEIFMYKSLMSTSIPAALARAESWRALYGILGNMSCHLSGPPELSARLPALFFGVAVVPVLYCVLRSWFGRGVAVFSVIFLVVSTFHVWYSQDASAYSMAFLFGVMAMWLLHLALQDRFGWLWLMWGLMAALTICSHWYIGGLLLAGQLAFLGLLLVAGKLHREDLVRLVIVLILAGAISLTFMAISVPRQIQLFSVTFTDVTQRGPMLDNLVMLGQWLVQSYASLMSQIAIGFLCCIGAVVCCRKNFKLAVYIALSTAIMIVHWSLAKHQIICFRYAILTLLPVCVFFGLGVTSFASYVSSRTNKVVSRWCFRACILMCMLMLAMASYESLGSYYARERYSIRPMAGFVDGSIAPDDAVFFGGFGFDKFSYYAPSLKHLVDYDALRSVLEGGDEFWLVYWFPNYYYGMPPDVKQAFDARAKLCFRYTGFRQSQIEHDYESFCWKVDGLHVTGNIEP